MASSEREATVGDYVSLVRGTTYKGSLVGEPGPALLGLGSIEPGGGFRIGHYKTYGGDCPEELTLCPGDIYAALKGATKDGKMIGSVARVPRSVTKGRLTQDTVKLVFRSADPDDAAYLHWILRTQQYREYCAGHAQGSAVVALSRRDFLAYPVPPMTAARRRAIALLDALDDKIELNRRMNETLEAMARALFKSWFVDFDPVRAKAEGRARQDGARNGQPRKPLNVASDLSWPEADAGAGAEGDPGLPEPLVDLFSDSFEDSELGEIPKRWTIKSIGDLADVVGGSTPSTKEPLYWEGGTHHWATPKDLSGLSVPVLLDTERRITDAGLSQIGSGLLPKGTVLLSSRAPIGYLAVAEIPVAINQGFIAMMPKKWVSNLFLLLWASVAHEEIVSRANGSTFLEISKANFRPISVVVPSAVVLQAFDGHARPLYERIVECERESRTLAALRDTLLPKLISGEIRLKEAEKIVGAVT